MSENTTATAELTAEQKAAAIEALAEPFKTAVVNLNNEIKQHNANVSLIKAAQADKSDPRKFADEFLANYTGDDPEVIAAAKLIETAKARLESAWLKAIGVVNKQQDDKPTEEQITAAHEATKKTSADIRAMKTALATLAGMIGQDFNALLDDVQNTRGVSKGGSVSASGGTISRPRFTSIFLWDEEKNDWQVTGKEIDKNGTKEFRSTISFLAQEMSSRLPHGTSVAGTDIQKSVLDHLGEGYTWDKITAGQVIEMDYPVEVKNSNGEVTDTKVFKIKLVK